MHSRKQGHSFKFDWELSLQYTQYESSLRDRVVWDVFLPVLRWQLQIQSGNVWWICFRVNMTMWIDMRNKANECGVQILCWPYLSSQFRIHVAFIFSLALCFAARMTKETKSAVDTVDEQRRDRENCERSASRAHPIWKIMENHKTTRKTKNGTKNRRHETIQM